MLPCAEHTSDFCSPFPGHCCLGRILAIFVSLGNGDLPKAELCWFGFVLFLKKALKSCMRLGEKNLRAEILCLDLILGICNSTFGMVLLGVAA